MAVVSPIRFYTVLDLDTSFFSSVNKNISSFTAQVIYKRVHSVRNCADSYLNIYVEKNHLIFVNNVVNYKCKCLN